MFARTLVVAPDTQNSRVPKIMTAPVQVTQSTAALWSTSNDPIRNTMFPPLPAALFRGGKGVATSYLHGYKY